MTQAEYIAASSAYKKETGHNFLDDHRVTCYAWPILDKRFGQLVVTDKDFYAK